MHVAIIGNGVAGVSTAFRIRRHQPDWKITMISGESKFHYSRPALMYIFMGHMRYRETKPYEDKVWDEQSASTSCVTGSSASTPSNKRLDDAPGRSDRVRQARDRDGIEAQHVRLARPGPRRRPRDFGASPT